MHQQRSSHLSCSGIVLAMCISFGGLFVIPAAAQAPGFGGVFYASASGSIDLTFAPEEIASGIPIPTTGMAPLVILAAAMTVIGGAAFKRRRSSLP